MLNYTNYFKLCVFLLNFFNSLIIFLNLRFLYFVSVKLLKLNFTGNKTKSQRLEALLHDLGPLIGIPSLVFNKQELCLFIIGESYHVTLRAFNESLILLYPKSAPHDIVLDLLASNLRSAELNGPYMCFDELSETLFFVLRVPLNNLDAQALEEKI